MRLSFLRGLYLLLRSVTLSPWDSMDYTPSTISSKGCNGQVRRTKREGKNHPNSSNIVWRLCLPTRRTDGRGLDKRNLEGLRLFISPFEFYYLVPSLRSPRHKYDQKFNKEIVTLKETKFKTRDAEERRKNKYYLSIKINRWK